MGNPLDIKNGTWITGTLARDGHTVLKREDIPFGGAKDDARGFVRQEDLVCEDGVGRLVLWTHPRWASGGTIKGFLPWSFLPTGAVFSAKVGFAQGATGTDGVRFQVWVRYHALGGEHVTRVVDLEKRYDGAFVEVRADLSWLGEQTCQIELRVDSGRESRQDWAVWSDLRIESREGPIACNWRLRPTKLTVVQRDCSEPSGDDPALVAIYFRTTLGHRGSTRVLTRTKLFELGTDRNSGAVITIPDRAELTFDDVLTAWRPEDLGVLDGVSIAGLVLVGIEKDSGGDDVVRGRIQGTARKILSALRTHIEPLTLPIIMATPSALSEALGKVEAEARGNPPPNADPCKKWLGHDMVGQNRLTLLGLNIASFDALVPMMNDTAMPLDADARVEPVSPLIPRLVCLDLAGSGSRWTVDVSLEKPNVLVPVPTGI